MATISILTGAQDEYLSVELDYYDETQLRITDQFDSGDIVIDWYKALKHYMFQVVEIPDITNSFLSFSSSVDTFLFEEQGYRIAYLHMNEENMQLLYITEGMSLRERNHVYEGLQIIVPTSVTMNWNQYKTYCNGETEEKEIREMPEM